MSSKKTIVVLGATGLQGGSVIETYLAHSNDYHIRAVSRNVSSEKAKALTAKGVEVVAGNTSEVSSLVSAFKGANIVFSTTDFWGAIQDPNSHAKAVQQGKGLMEWGYDNELSQGKNIIDAAAQTEGLERLIFSGLANFKHWSGGKYTHVYHFDAKAHATDYAREVYPDLWAKTSIIQAGWYLENWRDIFFMQPKKSESGVYDFVINIPANLRVPLIATYDDLGPLVKALVDESKAGKNLIAYREYMNVENMVKIWSELLNVPAKVTSVKLDPNSDDAMVKIFAGIDPTMVTEMAECYACWEEFGYEARDDPSVIHPNQLAVAPQLGSVKDWIARQDWTKILQA